MGDTLDTDVAGLLWTSGRTAVDPNALLWFLFDNPRTQPAPFTKPALSPELKGPPWRHAEAIARNH